jgi:hypothetical protein
MEDEAKPGYLLQMQAECSVRWEQRQMKEYAGAFSFLCSEMPLF